MKSLPLSETETGQMWYAPNRLGYSTLGLFCWGWGMGPAGRKIMVLCQVMEKPGYLTAAIFLWLLPQIVVVNERTFPPILDNIFKHVAINPLGAVVSFDCFARYWLGVEEHEAVVSKVPDRLFDPVDLWGFQVHYQLLLNAHLLAHKVFRGIPK